jgi:hypothetical protein
MLTHTHLLVANTHDPTRFTVSTGDPGNRIWPATRWSYDFAYDLTSAGVDPSLYGLRTRLDFDPAEAYPSAWYQVERYAYTDVSGVHNGLQAKGGNSLTLGYCNIDAADGEYVQDGVNIRVSGSANYPGFGGVNNYCGNANTVGGFDARVEGRYEIEHEIYEIARPNNVIVSVSMSVRTVSEYDFVPSFNQCGGGFGASPTCAPAFVPLPAFECPTSSPTQSPTTSSPTDAIPPTPATPPTSAKKAKSAKKVTQEASTVSTLKTSSLIPAAFGAVIAVTAGVFIAVRRRRFSAAAAVEEPTVEFDATEHAKFDGKQVEVAI